MEEYFIVYAMVDNAPDLKQKYEKEFKERWDQELLGHLGRLVEASIRDSELEPQEHERLDTQHEFTVLKLSESTKATDFADKLLQVGPGNGTDEWPAFHFRIGIEAGTNSSDFKTANGAEALARYAVQDEIIISTAVYDNLPLEAKDRYDGAEKVNGATLRRRFKTGLKRCFVISPIGHEDSEIRDRANSVFDRHIKPACASQNYQPVRSDQEYSTAIRGDLMKSLNEDPMVIAYLGRSPWNPNVMVEVGYRIAAEMPIVLLRDSVPDAELSDELPFDLTDRQVITVSPEGSDTVSERETRTAAKVANAIKEREMDAIVEKAPWESLYAVATIDVGLVDGEHMIVEASPDAARLLGHSEGIVQLNTVEVLGALGDYMPKDQFAAFAAEQKELLGRLLAMATKAAPVEVKSVRARTPMYFDNHPEPDFNHRAILPLIFKYRNADGVVRLH
ncbi:MAG: hypothetical protein ABFS02_12440, partial [Pseudomonadota bacterium]